VVGVVMDADRPARVSDSVIEGIRRREIDGAVELPSPPRLRVGDRVRIMRGSADRACWALSGHERAEACRGPIIAARWADTSDAAARPRHTVFGTLTLAGTLMSFGSVVGTGVRRQGRAGMDRGCRRQDRLHRVPVQ
jgi:hypothetical protein